MDGAATALVIKRVVPFDPRAKGFGNHFLFIKDPHEFLKRTRNAIKKSNHRFSCSMVQYLDFSEYTGKKTVFQKDIKYTVQKEFRIFIENTSGKPIAIEIGDLSDISVISPSNCIENFELIISKV